MYFLYKNKKIVLFFGFIFFFNFFILIISAIFTVFITNNFYKQHLVFNILFLYFIFFCKNNFFNSFSPLIINKVYICNNNIQFLQYNNNIFLKNYFLTSFFDNTYSLIGYTELIITPNIFINMLNSFYSYCTLFLDVFCLNFILFSVVALLIYIAHSLLFIVYCFFLKKKIFKKINLI